MSHPPLSPDDVAAEIIAEMKAKYGEPTPEDYAWADRVISAANASSGLFTPIRPDTPRPE